MNKYVAVAALFGIAGNAFAQAAPCGGFGNVKTASDIRTLLLGTYACVPGQWNEILAGGATGTVTDYKKGPSDPVDPTSQVGTYTIITGVANAYDRITYDYGSGGSFTYVITPKTGTTPGTYDFCNIATGQHITVTVQASTSC